MLQFAPVLSPGQFPWFSDEPHNAESPGAVVSVPWDVFSLLIHVLPGRLLTQYHGESNILERSEYVTK